MIGEPVVLEELLLAILSADDERRRQALRVLRGGVGDHCGTTGHLGAGATAHRGSREVSRDQPHHALEAYPGGASRTG